MHAPCQMEINVKLKHAVLSIAAAAVSIAGLASSAIARDQIRIVGSSTVYPFTTAVAGCVELS